MGKVLAGKVTGITKFGAFVAVAPSKIGLVHISEIAQSFVNDINEHLTVGQDVNVKIIGFDNAGRLNLSIKAALPQEPRPVRTEAPRSMPPRNNMPPRSFAPQKPPVSVETTFEDKLKRFMQDSDSKISDLKSHTAKKGSHRKGR